MYPDYFFLAGCSMVHNRLSGIKNARKIYNDLGFSSIVVDMVISYSVLVESTLGSGKKVLSLKLKAGAK